MTTNETGNPQSSNRPGTAGQSANAGNTGGGLDEFLREYTESQPSQEKQQPEDQNLLKTLVEDVKSIKQRQENQEKKNQAADVEEGISKAVKFLGEENSPLNNASEKVRRALLMEYARENPDFVQAFENQNTDPKAWQSSLAKARESLGDEFAGSEKSDTTADRSAAESLAASVSSKSAGDEDDPTSKAYEQRVANMSPAEFQEYVSRHRRPAY